MRKLLLTSVMLVAYPMLYAQHPMTAFIQKLKNTNKMSMVSYDYTLYLTNTRSGIVEDSIVGKMYKHNERYLDSNSQSIAITDGIHYCKIEPALKRAIAFKVNDLKDKLGAKSVPIKPNIIDISDSVILKYGKLKADKMPNGNFIIEVDFRNQNISKLTVELEKESYLIVRMLFEVTETDKFGDRTETKTVYLMKNFKYEFNTALLALERFVKTEQSKYHLTSAYSKYNLNTITY